MNFKLTHPLPSRCLVAVSGGVDSMAALHFLNRNPERVVSAIHINHGTGDFASISEDRVVEFCKELDVPLRIIPISPDPPDKGESKEAYWREQRYLFFNNEATVVHPEGLPVVVAHNMDDCFEEYIMCTMKRGFSGTIPYQHGASIRPFRLWKRNDIEDYARRHKIHWVEDPTNRDYTKFTRARIRMHIVPRIRNFNPGIYRVVEKVIREQDERDRLIKEHTGL
jgi:tRNA(Ile)-lysidine synthase